MDAAVKLGIYVPHFCYHRKLSIAANCRMCLVQVEKAPKPLPACATPATDGMKVQTHSEQAVKAQKGVMEFLLINHPLDCPICDQGGECQLQDLAVGYGASESRYNEPKRVVFHKNLGPLVSAEEMTRCIHCTRCVRFGQEIAGVMELGMRGRGEHSEIVTFVGRTVDSELSGNMIDLCPVGALTSKPFRYAARTWELARRKSVSPHDSLGSNLVVQVKGDRVMRVLPLDNEAVNECWISDRDRFSYEALGSAERLASPRVKVNGEWRDVDWATALEVVAGGLKDVVSKHGGSAIGVLASTQSTLEELALASRLARGLGCGNVDHRLRQGGLLRRPRARGHSVARHADRGRGHARPRAGRRELPAQGPPADRAAPAPGREARHAGHDAACGRRRLADAGRAQGDRAAVRDAGGARRHRRRGGAGRRQAGSGGARRDRASRIGPGDRGEPPGRIEARRVPRQRRRAARGGRADPRARAGAGGNPRRDARHARRGSERRRGGARRRAAGGRRPRRAGHARRAAQGDT